MWLSILINLGGSGPNTEVFPREEAGSDGPQKLCSKHGQANSERDTENLDVHPVVPSNLSLQPRRFIDGVWTRSEPVDRQAIELI